MSQITEERAQEIKSELSNGTRFSITGFSSSQRTYYLRKPKSTYENLSHGYTHFIIHEQFEEVVGKIDMNPRYNATYLEMVEYSIFNPDLEVKTGLNIANIKLIGEKPKNENVPIS